MIFYVIEFQTDSNVGSTITYTYTDRSLAFQKYYEIMASASVSQIAKHGAMLLTEDLYEIDSKLAWRESEENESGEPESNEEENPPEGS